jgi:pSer/pThr/pTyr-binding forkhead associated (FHA) protein
MASLHVIRELEPGRRIELSREVTIVGRSPTCDIPVPDVHVSRQHCRMVRQGDRFYIEDMNSIGGTFVNNQRIEGATQLAHGDRIRVADFAAVFESGGTEVSDREATGRP